MSLLAIKYNVPSQGIQGNNNIWRIYTDIHIISESPEFHGMQGPGIHYVEHIEIEDGVDSWSGENLYKIGFALLCEGEIEYFIDSKSGHRHARIFNPE